MFLIWNGQFPNPPLRYVAVLLLALTQSLVFATPDDADGRPQSLDQIIVDFVGIPWMQGIQRVVHSSETSGGKEVRALIRGIESGETWALQMLDDLLKIERQISTRNIPKIKTDEQCIQGNAQFKHNIGYQSSRDNSCALVSIGKTFVINEGSNGSSPPSTCDLSSNNKTEAAQIFNYQVQKEPTISELDLEVRSSLYEKITSKPFTTLEISAIIVFLMIGAFAIACTICDIVKKISGREDLSSTLETLSKFSLHRNALAILSTKVTPEMVPAIHGIRFLSCALIVCGHRYITTTIVFGQRATLLSLLEGKNSPLTFIVLMGTYIVDSFLVITGFLTSYHFLKMMKSKKQINWSIMCLLRYFKITPSLAALILFLTVLTRRTGSGSLWESLMTQTVDRCQDSWWIYLLYVQNLVKNGNMCFPHGWYLALDMQLFWLSGLILYPLHHWPKFGPRVLGSFLFLSIVTPAIILANNGYSNANLRFDMSLLRLMENLENYYMPTYNRACPYLVGILLGYDIATKKRRLTQVNVAINWLISCTLLLFCICFTNRIYNSNFAYDLQMEIASALLVRPFWSIAIAWIIYACTQGYGGLVTRFLSLPLFFPLSRLSYCIFLVHVTVQVYSLTSLQAPPNYLGSEMMYGICSDLVLSIAVAFSFSLFIESPAIVLIKILTHRDPRREQSTLVQQPEEKATSLK